MPEHSNVITRFCRWFGRVVRVKVFILLVAVGGLFAAGVLTGSALEERFGCPVGLYVVDDSEKPGAQFGIGEAFEKGEEMPRNYDTARRCYIAAAKGGSVWAQVKLGGLYLNGRGVAKSHQRARAWYLLSAEAGNIIGQMGAGRLLAEALGEGGDRAEAYKWFALSKSDEVNESPVGKAFAKLLATLTSEQKAEGERRAKAWKPAETGTLWRRVRIYYYALTD